MYRYILTESEDGADNAEGAYDDDSSMGIKVIHPPFELRV